MLKPMLNLPKLTFLCFKCAHNVCKIKHHLILQIIIDYRAGFLKLIIVTPFDKN